MLNIGRNDPCPCGSGKKFKKCHLGHEDELIIEKIKQDQKALEEKLLSLPEVHYGRSREILERVSIPELTGKVMGIKFIDLTEYLALIGPNQEIPAEKVSASQIININKTKKIDPNHIYIAITPYVNDSTVIHQMAHVLSFFKDVIPLPGTFSQVSAETGIPIEHLDHPEEFAEWLEYLKDQFQVELDAEDRIISYLKGKGVLLKGEEIQAADVQTLISRSTEVFNFLKEHKEEIDLLIKHRVGYIGEREKKEFSQ